MQISLWQQFSSNHSSDFTIVGEFKTSSEAQHAAAEVKVILDRINAWHAEHETESEEAWSSGDWIDQPSPIEEQLAGQYNIEWRGAIDWSWNAFIEIVLDRFVFITPTMRPEGGGRPFDQLMDRLGGRGFLESNVYGDVEGIITFDLVCKAPDDTLAAAIRETYLGFDRRIYQAGRYLHFDRWRFNETPHLPRLLEELGKRGCVDIGIALTQIHPAQESELHDETDRDLMIEILQRGRWGSDRMEAAEFLGRLKDRQALQPLLSALETGDESLKASVVNALGNLADPKAVEPVLQLLKHHNRWIRANAIDALSKIKDERVVQPLVAALHDHENWEVAGQALLRVGAPARAALTKVYLPGAADSFQQRVYKTLQGFR